MKNLKENLELEQFSWFDWRENENETFLCNRMEIIDFAYEFHLIFRSAARVSHADV